MPPPRLENSISSLWMACAFDHALIDCFFATRLLRVGGYLVIDDTDFAIARVVDHLRTYPCYRRSGSVRAEMKKTGIKATIRRLLTPCRGLLMSSTAAIASDFSYKSKMVALKKSRLMIDGGAGTTRSRLSRYSAIGGTVFCDRS